MADINQLHRTIGKVEESLERIDKKLDQNDTNARSHRDKLEEEVKGIAEKVDSHMHRIENLEKIGEKVEPAIKTLDSWKSKITGGVFVLGIVGTIVLVIVSSFWEMIVYSWDNFVKLIKGEV